MVIRMNAGITTAVETSGSSQRRVYQRFLVEVPLREEQDGMGDGVRHLVEGRVAIIREGVAGKVITGIILGARDTAVVYRLLSGLATFSASELAARRDDAPDCQWPKCGRFICDPVRGESPARP